MPSRKLYCIIALIALLILVSIIARKTTHQPITGVIEGKKHDDRGIVYMMRYNGIGHTITPVPYPERFYLKVNGKWITVTRSDFNKYDKGDYYEQNEEESNK